MELEWRRELTDTPCPCQSGTSFPQLLEISPERGTSLSAVMSLDARISSLLPSVRTCNQCSNDARVIQDVFSALKNVLRLLEAEQSVYIPTSRTQTSRDSNGRPSSQHLSFGLSDASRPASTYPLKERFTFGNIVLNDRESTIIAKRLIRDAALRIGQSLRWISVKCRSRIAGSIHQLELFNQEMKSTTDRVKIILARTA